MIYPIKYTFTFPTDGNPIMTALASPDFKTSNPSPFSPFFPVGSSSWPRYFASFAFSVPRWYSVAKNLHNNIGYKIIMWGSS